MDRFAGLLGQQSNLIGGGVDLTPPLKNAKIITDQNEREKNG